MINFSPRIQYLPFLFNGSPEVAVLGLHEIHPIVSGNKWYKLAPYLKEAQELGCTRIITSGGAFSNHIIATAFGAQAAGLKSVGWIRGEEAVCLSPTLEDARRQNMELVFFQRSAYAAIDLQPGIIPGTKDYFIPAGGKGLTGVRGASTILSSAETNSFTHIIAACGTGTMLAGLQLSAAAHQKIIGISVLNNQPEPLPTIQQHLQELGIKSIPEIFHYAYGGYAKVHPEVINLMREAWVKEKLPLDFVYTGKLFSAVQHLLRTGYFPGDARLLLIHSGGLQGNRSLPKGSLPF